MVAPPLAALGLGLLLASPQLWTALRYYPHSIRTGKTADQKMEIGNIPLWKQLRNMIWPSVEPVDGVFGPEACTFIGLPALLFLPFAGRSWWWFILLGSSLLAMGNQTPLFGWTHRFHLRIPARYCYFISLSLAMLSLQGVAAWVQHVQNSSLVTPMVLLQLTSLLLTLPRLWPMQPYVQRWVRPLNIRTNPLLLYLVSRVGLARVSGLPYPWRTGQLVGVRTLGYNGGSQAQWMARFRADPNPNGSGAHDWFLLNEDGFILDWYGIRYAYTYRPLAGKWYPTPIPHLYENVQARPAPSWKEVAEIYGEHCTHRYVV